MSRAWAALGGFESYSEGIRVVYVVVAVRIVTPEMSAVGDCSGESSQLLPGSLL